MQYLLPQDCLLCGVNAGGEMLCVPCLHALPYRDHLACPRCSLPTPTGGICGRCLTKPPPFDRAVAAFDYRYPVAELVHAFKYGSQLALGRFLSDKLVQRLQSESWPDLIVPMPLYPSRLAERGFNQAAELARWIADATGLSLSRSALIKTRDTLPQVGLPWRDREANVRGAFACDADLAGMRVAIIDDVMTTGASLGEAAKVIKQQGATEVAVWVVARTLSDAEK